MGFGMGMGMASAQPRGYASTFDDWHLYRGKRAEAPAGAEGLVTITDCMGVHISSEYVCRSYARSNSLRERRVVYDEARERYGRGNYFIFFNRIGSD